MSTFLTTGGSLVPVAGTSWVTVATLVYPGASFAQRGVKPVRAYCAAAAGDSSTGLELVLSDVTGNAVAGPVTTYSGSGVAQLCLLYPVRTGPLRTVGPPQVLYLRARNKSAEAPESVVGQLTVEVA